MALVSDERIRREERRQCLHGVWKDCRAGTPITFPSTRADLGRYREVPAPSGCFQQESKPKAFLRSRI